MTLAAWPGAALVALTLGVLAGVAYWRIAGRDDTSWTRSAIKTTSTAALALAGALTGAPAAITAGLAAGSLGDLALSRPGPRAFLAGMGAFAVGHLAYLWHFVALWTAPTPPWAAMLGMVVLALSTEIWLAPRTGELRWPVRAYVVIIAAMAIAAMGLPGNQRLTQLGAALFVLSDLLLALHLFVAPRRWLALALWPAYWLGQALILTGSLA